MYPEYIGIYCCLIIIIIMQIVIVVMIKKFISSLHKDMVNNTRGYIENEGISGYVICMKCEQKYSADKKICPYCGAKRC